MKIRNKHVFRRSGTAVHLFESLLWSSQTWSTFRFDNQFKERELKCISYFSTISQNNLQTAHLEEMWHSFKQIWLLKRTTILKKKAITQTLTLPCAWLKVIPQFIRLSLFQEWAKGTFTANAVIVAMQVQNQK